MIGVVGKLKITYTVSGKNYEDFFDLIGPHHLKLSGAPVVCFSIEEVNYIEDTVYGAVLSMISPRLIEEEFLIDGRNEVTFQVPEYNVFGTMCLRFFN